jgi:alpha-2-macroglobulin
MMSSRKALSWYRTPIALGLLGSTLAAVALVWGAASPQPDPAAKPSPFLAAFPRTEAARNPVTLQLQADEGKVVGWVSGIRDLRGKAVIIKVGDKTHERTLDKDNTFTWDYAVAKPALAEVVVGDEKDGLRGSVSLAPPSAAVGPAAFFVVDRTAYRPGQALHFAGFLRKQDKAGVFAPIADKAVEVELVSERKKTKAVKLKLTSDKLGRIVGSYTFTDADALDHYTLSIPTYKGSARVLLGEYRKSKVRLKISGTTAGEKMKLTLEGLDFLDKPIAVTKASFAAQVVRRAKQKTLTLKAEDFVHHEPKTLPFSDLESLSEEDLLLWEAQKVNGQTFPGLGNYPLAQFASELKPAGAKPAEHSIDLKKEWLRGDCALIVQAVITDSNGREQRASTTIPIDGKASATDKRPLELKLARRRFFTGETVEVRAEGKAVRKGTLVVMKLSFQSPSTPVAGLNPYYGRLSAYRSSYRYRPILPQVGTTETIRRTMVTAVPFDGDLAKVKLDQPGAYKLIAVMPKDDGTSAQEETTVVVKRIEDVPPITLKLDKEELSSGDRLTGVLQSRFADARALLTLRDSTGIRLTRPITFAKGVCRLDEKLPAGLRYGCTVDVIYPAEAGHSFGTHAFTRVVPADQILEVKVETPGTVLPGSTVELNLSVNRSEPTDLVVSVYDQSLLGIAADRSTDIRNFFLADERAINRLDLALVARRIGDMRLVTFYEKAKKILAADDKEKQKKLSPVERQALLDLIARRPSRHLYAADLATMLRLAGVDVYLTPHNHGYNWVKVFVEGEKERLVDVMKHDNGGWHLVPRFVGNTLLLHETHTSYANQGYAWHPVFGMNYGYGGYGGYGQYGYWGNNLNFWMDGTSNQLQTFSSQTGRVNLNRIDHFSQAASGNSAFSYRPEGQGFISHMPQGGPALLIDADADQSHIGVRRDFSDSAFWNATVRTDEHGKAKVSFKLPDSLTNWQVVVTAISPKMHVGSAKASFRTFKPVMVWPMLPRTFTEGDKVEVFASVHNRSDEPQRIKVRLKVENGKVLTAEQKIITVEPKSNVPVYWTFAPGTAGFTQLLMTADCQAGSDASLKRLPVVPAAAEQVVTASGNVKKTATIEIPAGVDPASSRLEVSFAPSLAADLADTLNYLVEYPYGCVEQTMSRFLPAIKVAQILKQFEVKHPELEKKLPGCVAGGIKRLLELQQPDGGWGWNGNGQTHEMMTPYALYGLLQAEKAGYQIPNESAVNRGLDRLAGFINQMGDAQAADRVYCMYVFSHRRDLAEPFWTWLENQAKAKKLSDYALGLALEMATAKNKIALSGELVKQLRARAKKSGDNVYWETAGFSRWGDDKFEVTAQALRALVAYDIKDPLVDGTLLFFSATKRGNRWNSTKDTAMILYALTDYLAKTEYNPAAKKSLSVSVNGGKAQLVTFDNQLTKKISITGDKMKVGKNTLTFDTEMTGVLYRAVFKYWKTGRDIEPMDQGIKVTRAFHLLDDKGAVGRQLKSGDTVPRGSYVVSVVNGAHRLPVNMRYVLVENPKPGGGETVPVDDARFVGQQQACTPYVLREDREAMTCFHHEETPHSLVDRNVFLAELAGEYVISPATVELMYQTETRGHSGTFVLKVAEKKLAK